MTRPSQTSDPNRELRRPQEVISLWQNVPETQPEILSHEIKGPWWELLAELGITLLVTREYEHLLMALACNQSGPQISTLRIPHPSGIAVNHSTSQVYVASSRNPNQIYTLEPTAGLVQRRDRTLAATDHPRLLVPTKVSFYPGCTYLHDLALIGNTLYANSVGQNTVLRIHPVHRAEHAWWPACIDSPNGPRIEANYLQLNSIAPGKDLESSFFTASSREIGDRLPGDPDFPVDGRGVIFSGATRDVICTGLTRPHSARLSGDQLWVANSGYGEVGTIDAGSFHPAIRLPGWTRGLMIHKDLLFVGTSRVLPRFQTYAPGLALGSSLCGIHAIEMKSARTLASIAWPAGNQIFAVDWMPAHLCDGLPYWQQSEQIDDLFYAYKLGTEEE